MAAPASKIPRIAKISGAKVFEFNLLRTDLTNTGIVNSFVEGPCEITLPKLTQFIQDS